MEEQFLLDVLLHDLTTNAIADLEKKSSNISMKPASLKNDTINKAFGKQNHQAWPAPRHFAPRMISETMNNAISLEDDKFLHMSYQAISN